MLKRRLFLQLTASLPALLLSAGSRAETEFERYQREQRAGVQNIKKRLAGLPRQLPGRLS